MRWAISVTRVGEKINILSYVIEKPEEKGHLEVLDLEGEKDNIKKFLKLIWRAVVDCIILAQGR